MPKIEQLEDGKKVKIELEGGEIFEGDWLTATQKLAESQEQTKKWGQGLKTEVETLKTQPRVEPQKPPVNAEEEQLRSYLADQTARYLGLQNGQELKQRLDRIGEISENTANRAVAAEFMDQCPDFPNTQDSINKLAQKMDAMGYDYTPQSMIAAHMLCLREGSYKPLTDQEIQSTVGVRTAPVPPPMIRSGSPDSQQSGEDLSTMPLDKLREKYMKDYFAQQGRQ